MADRQRRSKAANRFSDDAGTPGSGRPRRPAGWIGLAWRVLSTGALCLAFAGCSVAGGGLRNPIDGLKPLSSGLWPKSSKRSFAEAVESDPFPAADQANVQVSASQ
jgi:hypothetical protein